MSIIKAGVRSPDIKTLNVIAEMAKTLLIMPRDEALGLAFGLILDTARTQPELLHRMLNAPNIVQKGVTPDDRLIDLFIRIARRF